MPEVFGSVLGYLSDPIYWFTVLAGIGLATAAGIIPGVTATQIMAITFPFIVLNIDDPAVGLVLLATITGTANTFNSIPAMFFGMVEGGVQVTYLEGHQLVRRGLGAFAMGAVYAVSAIGGLVGALTLLIVLPLMRPFVLQFSFPEIAALGLFGLAMVAILSRGAMTKGLIAAGAGLLLGTVGTQGYTGADRFTFGLYDLELGLPLVAAILGLMTLPEMIDLTANREAVSSVPGDVSTREVWRGFREGLRRWRMAIRQSVFGCLVGAIPGMGSTVITWMAYGFGIIFAKDRSQFGKGSLDGLLFAESAENAKEGGQAIPTLALGIPGSTGWILVLVAMLFYGVVPGPNLLRDHLDIVGLIVITLAIGNLILTMIGLAVTGQIVKLTRIPYAAIGAVVIPITILGAYLSELLMIVFPVIAIFTVVGLLMKHYGWPRPPLILAIVIGPVIEDNLWSAISVYGVHGILTRPLTIGLLILVVVVVVVMQIAMRRTEVTREAVTEVARQAAPENAELIPAPVARTRRLGVGLQLSRPRWRNAHLMPIGLIVISAAAFIVAADYSSSRAALFPLVSSSLIFILSVVHLAASSMRPPKVQGQIMDLGLLSAGQEGAKRAGLIVVAMLGVYVLVLGLIGLQYAGMIFAFLLPLALMSGRSRWKVAIVSTVAVTLFTFGIGEWLSHVFWPEPFILDALFG